MKSISLRAAAFAAAFVVPSVAHAQAYIQVQGGLDHVSADGASDSGVAYGVAVGYDLATSGSLFFGVEGSLDDSSAKDCVTDVDVEGDELCLKTGRDVSGVFRFGTNLGGGSQLYVLAGYTNARLKATYDDGEDSSSIGSNLEGVRFGAGYKHAFSEKLYGKIEYRYSNYEAGVTRQNVIAAVGMSF